jgi:hypothetical protein
MSWKVFKGRRRGKGLPGKASRMAVEMNDRIKNELYACVLDKVIFPDLPEQCYDPKCVYLLELNRNDLDYLKRMGYVRRL